MKEEDRQNARIKALTKKVHEQEAVILKYKRLAETVHQAETLEHDIYEQQLDDSWIAVSKADYEQIMEALSQLDELSPWKTTLERRLGRV